MDFTNKSILIVGMGQSGKAAALRLKDLGASVVVVDSANDEKLQQEARELEARGVQVALGEDSAEYLQRKDLVVVSPGVPSESSLLQEAASRKIAIWSEIELGYQLTDCFIIGITGTNGKTTTTLLLEEIFRKAGIPALSAGNIGFPFTQATQEAKPNSWLITEVSSFQLENIIDFRPHIAVLLNITEDHLDRHRTFEEYVQSKKRLFINQTINDYAVINFDDKIVRNFQSQLRAQIVPFSKIVKKDKGVCVDRGEIVSIGKEKNIICRTDDLKIKGDHNVDNCLAASGAALAAGISPEIIGQSLIEFKGVEHRLEYIKTLNGVDYYNDSKATNPDATVKALQIFNEPVVLLAGGRNKGNSLASLAEVISRKAKAVVLFGESADEIESLLRRTQSHLILERALSLPEAVVKGSRLAKEGEVVLLSPACASFDMFSGYKERGMIFKEAVEGLGKKEKSSFIEKAEVVDTKHKRH